MSADRARPDGVTRGTLLPAGYYLTTTEAAVELGVTASGVVAAIKRGRLLGIQLGRTWLVRAEEVARYRNGREPTGPGPHRGPRPEARGKHVDQAWPRVDGDQLHAVWYRHDDGRETHLTRFEAQMLDRLVGRRLRLGAGEYADRVWQASTNAVTRSQVTARIEKLVQAGLIVRLIGRDGQGGRVPTVHLGARGRDAWQYCKDRGLI